MNLRKFLVRLTLVWVIILVVVVWFRPSNEDFRSDNPYWNGVKNLTSIIPISPLESLSQLPSSPRGATLILIPYLDFTATEMEKLKSFVTQGGTLILADDYGYGNKILEFVGLKARFSGQALLDPISYYRNKWLPRIPHLIPSAITSDIGDLVFNHGTSLIKVETGDVLALSSSFSFLDLSGNQVREENEPTGPLPVMSRHNLGGGQIILLADPSVFIKGMQTMEGNPNFIHNIASITTSSLLIDQSHLPPTNLHQAKNLLSYVRGFLATPSGTLGLTMLILTVVLMPIWRRPTAKLLERR